MTADFTSIRINALQVYFALLTSLAAVYAYDFLPTKKHRIIHDQSIADLYMDSNNDGTSHGIWLSASRHGFRCTFDDTPAAYKYCGANVQIGNGANKGLDFSGYDTLRLKIQYTGESSLVRIYFRNFVQEYSDAGDPNTTKYMRSIIPARELNTQQLIVPIQQFTLADWWIRDKDVPAELAYPEFNNIVHFGIDFPYPIVAGNHDVLIESVTLEGALISRENWYLSVLATWLMLLTLHIIRQFLRYQKATNLREGGHGKANSSLSRLEKVMTIFSEPSTVESVKGTINRRNCQKVVSQLMERNFWPGTGLILLNVDYFETLKNKTNSTDINPILETLVDTIRTYARPQDNICRWSEDDFLLICPSSDAHGVTLLAEKIRRSLSGQTFLDNSALTLTISAGTGEATGGEPFEDVFRRVDHALSDAKNAGRNCVREAAEPTTPIE